MIKRLRRRMTLMVIAVLILISAGIVLAIHYANERSIAAQAESTLSVLAENSGSRPSLPPRECSATRGETIQYTPAPKRSREFCCFQLRFFRETKAAS